MGGYYHKLLKIAKIDTLLKRQFPSEGGETTAQGRSSRYGFKPPRLCLL